MRQPPNYALASRTPLTRNQGGRVQMTPQMMIPWSPTRMPVHQNCYPQPGTADVFLAGSPLQSVASHAGFAIPVHQERMRKWHSTGVAHGFPRPTPYRGDRGRMWVR